jgi:hypothetical protein
MSLSNNEVQKLLAQARAWADDSWIRNKQHSWERYGLLIQALEEVNQERELFRSWFFDKKEQEKCLEAEL